MYQQDYPAIIMDGQEVETGSKFEDVTIEAEEEGISDIENYNEHYPTQTRHARGKFRSVRLRGE